MVMLHCCMHHPGSAGVRPAAGDKVWYEDPERRRQGTRVGIMGMGVLGAGRGAEART